MPSIFNILRQQPQQQPPGKKLVRQDESSVEPYGSSVGSAYSLENQRTTSELLDRLDSRLDQSATSTEFSSDMDYTDFDGGEPNLKMKRFDSRLESVAEVTHTGETTVASSADPANMARLEDAATESLRAMALSASLVGEALGIPFSPNPDCLKDPYQHCIDTTVLVPAASGATLPVPLPRSTTSDHQQNPYACPSAITSANIFLGLLPETPAVEEPTTTTQPTLGQHRGNQNGGAPQNKDKDSKDDDNIPSDEEESPLYQAMMAPTGSFCSMMSEHDGEEPKPKTASTPNRRPSANSPQRRPDPKMSTPKRQQQRTVVTKVVHRPEPSTPKSDDTPKRKKRWGLFGRRNNAATAKENNPNTRSPPTTPPKKKQTPVSPKSSNAPSSARQKRLLVQRAAQQPPHRVSWADPSSPGRRGGPLYRQEREEHSMDQGTGQAVHTIHVGRVSR
eukprot:CAMPEP_0172447776 /NCGR_PEP_ID=MMETSP1065-20121228/6993_1 /TAXON_ID=265537 /ORGANISM="Amphiprora paludosa, Strain CCMP125" /LENGTH=448 /DNA_ID=CAMNT_0013199145 /DNA_START=239 /DNA_END=1585 /DNA_ORIENTATION=+